jgi:hypothetical protein
MEPQSIFNAIVSVAAFLGGWVLNNITKAIERLDIDVRTLPHTYVSKDDYNRDIAEIKSICQQIFNKLDHKVDK